ncbi:beta-galactosidase [Salinibacterium sp. G-O1]|uniref:beta-galactosidase n=1 Tax=Salinibacterium sp. G-O1 TaxID=3046208 RepID=UPI0024BB65B6|nr:beta-galactosidase [Salinibacterium sp. G-O1]MDJ0335700.1 beta-galactosidase [Salinibacterium sp. G-O1]
MVFGCDYNPEQWGSDVWRDDVRLMRDAGIGLVALNIFGWSNIQPREGEFDFADLDEIIDLLHANNIRVNLGTGTASAPPWLSTAHPEILPMAEDGTTRYPGGRQAWCPSSPVFREYALHLVEAVASRYGAHPAVALWHVSNELGCHNALCYDDDSAVAFRTWLRHRYDTIDALNEAWGTSFWSQRYGAWDEILPPRAALSLRNPAQRLDFQRFSSDELLDYYRSECAVIRRHSAAPVTTNFMVTAHIRNLDYWTWVDDVDLVANDHYLDHRLPNPTAELSFAADLTRGLAKGEPWLLMESSAGAVNWQPHNLPKQPGEMTRNSVSHIARGADGVCFFQWRASPQGAEKFHSALIPHAGTDSEVWRETVALGRLMTDLAEVAGTRVESHVAILFSWEAWWAADGEARPSQAVNYLQQVHAVYSALRELGVTVDVVSPSASLDGYRLAVVPSLHLVSDDDATRLTSWVEAGGHAVVTFNSGIVDDCDRVRLGGYPGAFRDMLGVRVEEFVPVLPGDVVHLDSGATAGLWTERLTLTTADAISRYTDGPVPGLPAVTRNMFGAGEARYIATALDETALREQFRVALVEANVAIRALGGSGAVEVVRRASADRSYVFVINNSSEEVTIPVVGHDLVTKVDISQFLRVPAGAARIVRETAA